ncbi:hypothetical protein BGW37DRAFT_466225 [Umbelopsis sp. PMI_123]|nr:hypothetical protein BGW37DRAFT_466225 [Umbelopsis sp. PMI_123]
MPRLTNPLKKKRQVIRLEDDTGFNDEQFDTPETPIPWKAIYLATGLLVVGSMFIILGVLIKLGIITSEIWLDRGIPFLVLGCIMFIPGAYHCYVAYYAYYRYPGYDFSMIPDMD